MRLFFFIFSGEGFFLKKEFEVKSEEKNIVLVLYSPWVFTKSCKPTLKVLWNLVIIVGVVKNISFAIHNSCRC